ncbi:putative peptidoglycan-binding domain-containing protein [Desulfosporosinus acidiphilus SJ4]|uniref:Putative peptidoglycan-binding domain-containing protein n=1 Tax=Desulfosporosinus acidiphilus (strain DSM 22704 / JCM 16185 / SJ4) TaxID=646529 RepID=I4D562_DESAJ|nr:peptidoglycan-binding protein [Desulfosporosinus acidiphilus]AFM40936.1 putative peptidoglycan-binding domain-containing protein [Desulfosporosinus acidiphilus SJ4]
MDQRHGQHYFPHYSSCPILKEGSTGPEVLKLQELLMANGYPPGSLDGIFGPITKSAVLAFQAQNNLVQDGVVGKHTWNALGIHCGSVPVDHCPTLYERNTGPAVIELQEILKRKGFYPGMVDGVFGPITKTAVLSFQENMGLVQDGIVGRKTWNALGVHCI